MNRRISGWQLALLLLIPLALIAAAIWVGLRALDDDQSTAITPVDAEVAVTQNLDPTSTAVPVTQPVAPPEPTTPPTSIPLPTAAPTTAPPAEPTATPIPEPTATPVPAPTSPPAPTSTPVPASGGDSSGGDTAATPDPEATASPLGEVALSCGSIPKKLAQDADMGPFEAETVPATAADSLRFNWNFGNGFTVGSKNTPAVSYDTSGDYTVTLSATDIASGAVFTETCGTVTVGSPAPATVEVSCSVKPKTASLKLEDALPGDIMVVTVSWKPASVPLRLTYGAFSANAPLILENDDASPNTQENGAFGSDDAFTITWQYVEKDLRGTLSCPAYPK